MSSTGEGPASYIGEAIPRREDAKIIIGRTNYVDDLSIPGMGWAMVVRSLYPHARIGAIDLTGALAIPGVIAAFTAGDLADEWSAPLPCAWPVTEDIKMSVHYPLTADKARYAGDGVAVIVAESRALAKDAAELVAIEYEPLDAVVDVLAAAAPDAPLVHDHFGTNRCYTWKLSGGEVDEAFAEAEVHVEERYRQQRLIPSAMEPRGVLVQPLPGDEGFTLWSSTQIPHILRTTLARTTGIAEAQLRIIAPDVGGGFGAKVQVYAEEALCLALSRRLGMPVKWIEERSEACLATHHARDLVQDIELAATREGKILAVRVRLTASMGAYLQLNTPGIPLLGAWIYTGAYDVGAYDFECVGVYTHTTPTDAYRGAGRPEATYAVERAIDNLAARLDLDPAEIRRRNFITQFPAKLASREVIDSGDYEAGLDRALEIIDYQTLRREQATRRSRGDSKALGIGFSSYIEMAGLAPSRVLGANRYEMGGWEAATIRMLPTGTIQVVIGTSPHGQGHATTFAQIAADLLGTTPGAIEVIHGDTASSSLGMDTYGSRSLVIGGVALYHAAEKLIAKGRAIAAHQIECSEDDLEYAVGRFTVKGTTRSMTLGAIATAAWTAHDLPPGIEPGFEATSVFDPATFSWPAGTHIAVVEADLETGDVRLARYVAVDDVGNVINPMIVEGQIHGALAQGIAQALYEEAVYDEDGNLLNGSFVNYLVPSAAELIDFEVHRTVTASTSNPLGVKSAGETGTIGSPPAVVNAVLDALAPYGVKHLDMPVTPEKVWRALKEAGAR
jgi:aerobic carbon-monoxide dehydrogenase large subunit